MIDVFARKEGRRLCAVSHAGSVALFLQGMARALQKPALGDLKNCSAALELQESLKAQQEC